MLLIRLVFSNFPQTSLHILKTYSRHFNLASQPYARVSHKHSICSYIPVIVYLTQRFFHLMFRIECKYCLISSSYLAFSYYFIFDKIVSVLVTIYQWGRCHAYHKEFKFLDPSVNFNKMTPSYFYRFFSINKNDYQILNFQTHKHWFASLDPVHSS